LTAAIDSDATTIFCEYPDGDHGIWTNTYNEPLIARWLFKQQKQPPSMVKNRSKSISGTTTGSSLIPVFYGNNVDAIVNMIASGGKYDLRIFDIKGSIIHHSVIDGSPQTLETVSGMLKLAPAIRWVSVRRVK
jgi:hypothetical protein